MEPIFKRFLAELIRWALRPPARPKFTLRVIGEEMRKNITEISFEDLPKTNGGEPNRDGVTHRKFTAKSNDVVFFEKTQEVAEGADNVPGFTVNLAQGVLVTLSLQDIDQAGNVSPTADTTFTPTDVIAPAQPGVIKMNVIGEVNE